MKYEDTLYAQLLKGHKTIGEVTESILEIYNQIIDFAESLGEKGDDLKDLAGLLMDHLERLKPMDY